MLGSGVSGSDLRQKAVSPARYGFHEARTFSGIPKGVMNRVDGLVEPVVEIDKRVGRPELLLQFFASHDFSWALH